MQGIAGVAQALNTNDLARAQILVLHLLLPNTPTTAKTAKTGAETTLLALQLCRSGLLKGGWDPAKHPRMGAGPNSGWFAPVADQEASDERQSEPGLGNTSIPVVDFSDGFHDAVVDAWIEQLRKAGIPAVKNPGIRVIGDIRVVGYPDILVHWPGQPVEALEVKTGLNPPLTENQQWYIPMLQIGGHIYSTDSRIKDLGLVPGVPFPL